jgi:DNA invertase Pin-like site-specific DNA recombinase
LVSAWPALALAGSFELLMTLIRTEPHVTQRTTPAGYERQAAPTVEHGAPPVPTRAPAVEETVRAWHDAGRSQRAIARDLGIDRRNIKRIIDHSTTGRSGCRQCCVPTAV